MQRDDGHGGDQGMCGDSVGDDSSHRQQAEEHPEARLRARLPSAGVGENPKLSAAVTPVRPDQRFIYFTVTGVATATAK